MKLKKGFISHKKVFGDLCNINISVMSDPKSYLKAQDITLKRPSYVVQKQEACELGTGFLPFILQKKIWKVINDIASAVATAAAVAVA